MIYTMNLLLTSTGLTNESIKNKFISLFPYDFSVAKVLFIVSATKMPEDAWYVNQSKDELFGLGIRSENFIIYHVGRKPSEAKLKSVNLIYVCGGNTFHLLEELNKSGLGKDIIEMIKSGIFYIGASAGSIIVTPNIKIAEPYDTNDRGLIDLNALNLTKFTIFPHYTESEEAVAKNTEDKLGIEVKRITDDQAILVYNNETELIEGEKS